MLMRTPPKGEHIRRLAMDGFAPETIAQLTGSTPGSVRTIICRMRRAGIDIPSRPDGLPINLDPTTLGFLEAEASKRGMPVRALCAALLRVVAQDSLTNAILDQ